MRTGGPPKLLADIQTPCCCRNDESKQVAVSRFRGLSPVLRHCSHIPCHIVAIDKTVRFCIDTFQSPLLLKGNRTYPSPPEFDAEQDLTPVILLDKSKQQ